MRTNAPCRPDPFRTSRRPLWRPTSRPPSKRGGCVANSLRRENLQSVDGAWERVKLTGMGRKHGGKEANGRTGKWMASGRRRNCSHLSHLSLSRARVDDSIQLTFLGGGGGAAADHGKEEEGRTTSSLQTNFVPTLPKKRSPNSPFHPFFCADFFPLPSPFFSIIVLPPQKRWLARCVDFPLSPTTFSFATPLPSSFAALPPSLLHDGSGAESLMTGNKRQEGVRTAHSASTYQVAAGARPNSASHVAKGASVATAP